jgi:GH25 family lysozyme M1 (1,4-beta-N-acetylmuramidase)
MQQQFTSVQLFPRSLAHMTAMALVRTMPGLFVFFHVLLAAAFAGEFVAPWKDKSNAIVIDAYEKNPIDWEKLVSNRQIVGFIGKGSDGLPPSWACPKHNEAEKLLCRKTFQNYWLKKQLYQSRKLIAKQLGLKWGVYHLGRPGNPIEQANHFIKFTEPDADDLMALDIEHDDPEKWISLEDAEIFVKHVKTRTGRYPVLYTNHDTAKRIAARRAELPVLSRLPLWYARYRSEIRGVFPMGNWESYALWQFSAQPNCTQRRCLYRVAGTKRDIDVNVSSFSAKELREQWPFGGLVPERQYQQRQEHDTMVIASVKPAKMVKPMTPVRYSVNLKIDMGKRKHVVLTSIAVPSPRTLTRETTATPDQPVAYRPGAVATYIERDAVNEKASTTVPTKARYAYSGEKVEDTVMYD